MGGGMQRPNWWVHFESPILARLEAWRLMRESRASIEARHIQIAQHIADMEHRARGSTDPNISPAHQLRIVPSPRETEHER